MGIIIRQSLKSTVVTIISAVIGALNTLMLMYLLPKAVYGLYTLTISYALFGSELLLLLTQIVYIIYVKKYEGTRLEMGFNKYLGRPNVYLTFIFLAGVTLYHFLISPQMHYSDDTIFYYLDKYIFPFFLLVISLGTYTLFTVILAARHKNTISAIAKDFIPRVFGLSVIALFYFDLLSIDRLIGLLFAQYILGSLVAYYFIRRFDFLKLKGGMKLNSEQKRELRIFRVTHIPFSLIWSLSLISVSLVYSFVFERGQAIFAVFSVSIFVTNFMNIPYEQLSRSALSTISEAMRREEMKKLEDIYQRANLNLMHTATFMAVWILAGLSFLVFMNGDKYTLLVTIAPFFIMGKWIDMSTGFSTELLMSSNLLSRLVYLSLLAFIFMIACYAILIPSLGDVGVALTMCLWYLFFNITKIIFVQRYFGLSPFLKDKFWPSIFICIPILTLQLLTVLYFTSPVINFATALLLSSVFLYIIYRKKYNEDGIKILQKIMKL